MIDIPAFRKPLVAVTAFLFPQAYVALSRATTLDGLHLLDFRVGVVKAHESVKSFYASLEVGAP